MSRPEMLSSQTILLCCNSVFGMVNFRGGVIRSLVSNGFRVIVVAPADAYVDELKAIGAVYIEWRLNGRGTSVKFEMSALLQLSAIYRSIRPDVAFHFTIKPVIYGAFVSRILSIPFISVVTGLGYTFINDNFVSRVARLMYRMTLRWSTEVWLLNEDDHQTLVAEGLLTCATVRMLPGEGIDISKFVPTDPVSTTLPKFLFVSRLIRDKGVFEYIEAARNLLNDGVKADFALLGTVDADKHAEITPEMVRAWEAEGIIKYLGTSKDVRPYISRSHCIVLPSYREGIPRCLLEASAMARPVIATNVPGCRDVVLDGKTGFLCDPQSAKSLAVTIKRFLVLTDAGRKKMGDQGRQFVCSHFDEKLILTQYVETLRKVLGN